MSGPCLWRHQTHQEEVERQKLHKDMMSLKTDGEDRGKTGAGANSSQVLRITRTFRNQQGREFTRTELVRRSMVIETYVKVRNTKDDTFIRQFASMDVQASRPPPPLSGTNDFMILNLVYNLVFFTVELTAS